MNAALLCATPDCDRRAIRTRDGLRVCSWHPEHDAPPVDQVTGKPRESVEQIAARTGAARRKTTTRPQPRGTNANVPRVRPARFTLDPADVAARYLAGASLHSLVDHFHVRATRIHAALAEQGVPVRKRGQVVTHRGPAPSPINPVVAVDRYQAGETCAEIARHFHACESRVRAVIRAAGVLRKAGHRTVRKSAA